LSNTPESVEPFPDILGRAIGNILSIYPRLYQFQTEEATMLVHLTHEGVENRKNDLGEADTLVEDMEVRRDSIASA